MGLAGAKLADGEWISFAHGEQYPLLLGLPPIWLVSGGRGAGKTRLGAEWVNAVARGLPPFAVAKRRHALIALVGETLGDVREVMVEGPSGILATARKTRARFEPSRRRVVWETGAVAHMFSSEDPESLRGPQFHAAWCDELAKWKNAEATFDMLQFGLRLGALPRQVITTTPRPTKLMKRLMADPSVVVSRFTTAGNMKNLAPGFIVALSERYRNSRLIRQELDGELIEDREDALWSRELVEKAYAAEAPEVGRIVVAVDPPASSRRSSDACGIVAAGRAADGRIVVLADASMRAAKPQAWANAAVNLFHRLEADCIVAEVNQGGDMVSAVIRAADASVPVRAVRARHGKWTRAEPVQMLYQQERVVHAGRFPALEDEMCDFGLDGLSGGRSPDRVDALVWAVSELTPGRAGEPRVRTIGD
ncbi:DNA-packaging protein [Mesorhizobium sp. IMUNJ 23232]|uniref:DNA-packaging protein n=1 Tax=Mesorhizobium sp. IMUNJ 23232 TaxID=3376064 RepID=UPI0037B998D0